MKFICRLIYVFTSLIILFGCASNQVLLEKYKIEKGTLSSSKSLPNLEKALSDEDETVRRKSLHYISRQGVSAVHALPVVIDLAENDPSEENRCYAIRVVALIDPDSDDILTFLDQRKNNDKSIKVRDLCDKLIMQRIGTSGQFAFAFDSSTEELKDIEVIFKPEFSFYNGYKVKHLTCLGVLPLKLEIKNVSDTDIFVDVDSIKLFDKNHIESDRLSPNVVIEKQKYSIAKSIIIGFPGVSLSHAIKANVRIADYCVKNVLKSCTLEPQTSIQGYLYFNVPNKIKDVAYWAVYFNVGNIERQVLYSIEYTFGGVGLVKKKDFAMPVNINKYGSHIIEVKEPVKLENKLIKLKRLYTKGLISEREYQEKREELLQNFN